MTYSILPEASQGSADKAIQQTFVRPTIPLVPETIALSAFDQYNGRHYTPFLLIFKLPDRNSFEVAISELQEGLARLLDEVPFLAGDVITEDESRDLLTLEISEDGGVIFKVKRMTESDQGPVLDFDELERIGFPASAFNPLVVCPLSFVPAAVAPCLQIQANLIRGGIILAAYVHHSIVDGDGSSMIFNRWAKHVAAVAEARIVPTSESLPAEALDRSALFPEKAATRELCDFPSFEDGRGQSNDGASWWNVGRRMEMNGGAEAEGIKVSHWYFTKDHLRQIEEKALPRNSKDAKMTGGTVLSAFIFRHYTRARRLEQQGIDEASYHNPCNVRSRIEPPLHPEYLGNSVVPSKTPFQLSELFSSDEEALYRIASAISSSIDWWSSDNIWDLLGAMEAWPRVREIERSMDLNHKTDLHVTNLSSFPMLNSYWGPNLGNLIALRFPAISMMDGFGIIMPRSSDGGLEIILFIHHEDLDVLKDDVEFTKHAQFIYA